MDRPYEPGVEEQRHYYLGLPAQPKLVARSSCHEWHNRRTRDMQWDLSRMVFPLEHDHPLVDAWNNPSGSLRGRITQALSRIPWNAIDILRFGWEEENSRILEEEAERPVTLLVSVAPNSTSWAQGYPSVVDCKAILKEYGFCGIHCEMKESEVRDFQSPQVPEFAPNGAPKLTTSAAADIYMYSGRLSRSECLGSPITVYESSTEGTKSLYLRVRGDSSGHKILALTCRHVVDEGNSDEYRYEEEVRRRIAEAHLNSAELGDDELERPQHRVRREYADLEMLSNLCDASSRITGHVAFAPPLHSRPQTRGDQAATWVRDWALIELHADQHESSWDQIENRVHLGFSVAQLRSVLSYEAPEMIVDKDEPDTLRLRDIISASELFHYKGNGHDKVTKLVGKSGGKTGTTFGWASGAKSLVRRQGSGDPHPTECEECCIVNIRHHSAFETQRFADAGDSGACVWDLDGRVGGIITSANGDPELGWDVTYATPMEWVIDDIKQHSFDVSLV